MKYEADVAYSVMVSFVGSTAKRHDVPVDVQTRLTEGLEHFARELEGCGSNEEAHVRLVALVEGAGFTGEAKDMVIRAIDAVVGLYIAAKSGDQVCEGAIRKIEEKHGSPFDSRVYPKGTLYAVVSEEDIKGRL